MYAREQTFQMVRVCRITRRSRTEKWNGLPSLSNLAPILEGFAIYLWRFAITNLPRPHKVESFSQQGARSNYSVQYGVPYSVVKADF